MNHNITSMLKGMKYLIEFANFFIDTIQFLLKGIRKGYYN